jgi:hypothetical protein
VVSSRSITAHLALAKSSQITYFQAIVLGLLQVVTELFPISRVGHAVIFPALSNWHNLVASESKPESFLAGFCRLAPFRDGIKSAGALLEGLEIDHRGPCALSAHKGDNNNR